MLMKFKPQVFLIALLPLALLLVYSVSYPFSEAIATTAIGISDLNNAQRSNIQLAASKVNGVVLKPGEEFSFNKVVGPRTEGRGYRAAPSYLGPDSPATIGGGICLLSSALYQSALEGGLQIRERVPHLRTIKTVPPGLDAAVWYGQADLRFKNNTKMPLQIKSEWSSQTLKVSLLGTADSAIEKAQLQRNVMRRTETQLVVELMRKQGQECVLVSRDLYRIAR